ncbi:SulP family inorganic anion transporter [Arthrobacter sp. UM1]|uniref:SulP family inorganic anion transporter n=1 Tax=Arthrobacter sp. UM1 TaxID=2766776 RepID=UPI001CF6FB10|nr:SulP family inorganic anion transporter [Arthrobacter sp. UM1]MCB4208128.1 SulP family inorganic anion transporter [Arthrobacter sp. UM1]
MTSSPASRTLEEALERQSSRLALRRPRVLGRELLAGFVTSLALIPEVLAFSIVAGVDPRVGLFTAVVMAVAAAVVGGRPGMVTAAAGAVALVTAPLVRSHGVDHLVLAVLLGGALQILLGLAGIHRLMRFVTRPVMVGFVNSLGTLMLLSQLPELEGVPGAVYWLSGLGVVIVFGCSRLWPSSPSPFFAIVIVTAVATLAGVRVPTVGDRGRLPTALPEIGLPHVPLSLDTLAAVAPYAVGIAVVGLVETLMTARVVDSLTGTPTDQPREVRGQGIANIAAGLIGGMGGCAMIGQSIMNVKASGGRTRISSAAAGLSLLVLVLVLRPIVAEIPMAALVAVMVFLGLTTVDLRSVTPARLREAGWRETAIMLVTVAIVVPTHNLALGVFVGAALSALLLRRDGRSGLV